MIKIFNVMLLLVIAILSLWGMFSLGYSWREQNSSEFICEVDTTWGELVCYEFIEPVTIDWGEVPKSTTNEVVRYWRVAELSDRGETILLQRDLEWRKMIFLKVIGVEDAE